MKRGGWSRKVGAGLVAVALALVGCSAAQKVERVDSDEVRDLSGYWNDTDSRLVSEEMVADALSRPWIGEFRAEEGHRPAVIVGGIRNLSHEHINVRTFVADIERALVNSGRVDFVAEPEQREEIRAERRDQDLNASRDTRNPMGRELGADFMLQGSINTIIDTDGEQQVRYYQVDLELVSLADNRKAWLGQKRIKKIVRQPSVRY
jgi:hypothetical protein